MSRRYLHKLSHKEIDKTKINPEKIICLYDGGGLQLTIKPNGSKLWEILYTSPVTKKRRRSGIGNYPDVSLKNAREILSKYKKLINENIDPIDAKNTNIYSADKKCIYFNDIIDVWLELKKRDLSERTHLKRVQQFDKFVKPYLKDIKVQDVKHPLIATILENKAKTSVETAYRIHNYMNQIYQYAISKGYCQTNIMANINVKSILPKMKTLHHPKITNLQTLKELVNAIENYHGNISVKNALRFVLHIPLRASNLVNLRWSYIDFERRTLTIPRNKMKVKDENLDDFKLYLTDEVLKILKEQDSISKNAKYVFTTHTYSDKPIHQESPNRALRLMGFDDAKENRKITLHGFRGTFRSLADTFQMEHNAIFEVKEAVLDHHGASKIVKAYNHRSDYFEQTKLLLGWWSRFIKKYERSPKIVNKFPLENLLATLFYWVLSTSP
jgi:integrase